MGIHRYGNLIPCLNHNIIVRRDRGHISRIYTVLVLARHFGRIPIYPIRIVNKQVGNVLIFIYLVLGKLYFDPYIIFRHGKGIVFRL